MPSLAAPAPTFFKNCRVPHPHPHPHPSPETHPCFIAEAICQIPLSRRNVPDSVFWLHNARGLFSVKSTYNMVRRLLTDANRGGTSTEGAAKNIWTAIWKLRLPNKIKIFSWRACHEILPTVVNLTRRKVLNDDICSVCTREMESTIHAFWDCAAVQDIWAKFSKAA